MTRWVDFVIAHRRRVLAAWLALFLLGGVAASNLGGLLSNRFSVPGAESERGLDLLKQRMGERSDGAFTLVATGVDTGAERAAAQSAARRAATVVRGGKAHARAEQRAVRGRGRREEAHSRGGRSPAAAAASVASTVAP